ncbi:MAG: methylated-DNA--[protein]-cysteine S-methyltransferase [Proteobacteria bacterium]|nr:methylated-DNA--[protein]-cysteine S-methyltransferase [Pseudomonadota bacterium]
MWAASLETPVGTSWIAGEEAISVIRLGEVDPAWRIAPEAFVAAREQLTAYLSGERTTFELDLAPAGTPFQKRVWAALERIPAGTTYGALASELGSVARAVGSANGANPIWVVVPCHRVIGADGSLTGYAGGVDVKRWLLDHEARQTSLF